MSPGGDGAENYIPSAKKGNLDSGSGDYQIAQKPADAQAQERLNWWDLNRPLLSREEKYLSETLLDEELEQLPTLKLTRGQALEIKKYINEQAQPALDMTMQIWQKDKPRILAVGEEHKTRVSRIFGIEAIGKLKADGATVLAVELPRDEKTLAGIKRFEETGDASGIPDVKDRGSFIKLLQAAREGEPKMEIVPVDTGDAEHRNRNDAMSENICRILDKDPQARVVFWVGSGHLNREEVHGVLANTADLIRKHYAMPTILINDPSQSLYYLTREVREPLMVPGKNDVFGRLPLSTFDQEFKYSYYNDYDYVVIAPSLSQ